jgi:hypothetical protein
LIFINIKPVIYEWQVAFVVYLFFIVFVCSELKI